MSEQTGEKAGRRADTAIKPWVARDLLDAIHSCSYGCDSESCVYSEAENEVYAEMLARLNRYVAEQRIAAKVEVLDEASDVLAARRDRVPGIAVPAAAAFATCIDLIRGMASHLAPTPEADR